MKRLFLILTLLFSLQSFGQMLKDIKEPKLYVEPNSIQTVNKFWQSDVTNDRKIVTTMVIGGLPVIGLDIYGKTEYWKRPINDGWVYRPFIIEIDIKNK